MNHQRNFYFFVRMIVGWLMRLTARMEITGVENVPAEGPLLFVSNHLSQIDSPLHLFAVPRQLRVFSAAKYRRNPFLFLLFEFMGCIWVRQFEADHQALREALRYLRQGGSLAVAPEGTRSRETHALLPGRGGAALMASRSGAPILPAGVWGTETFVGDLLHFRRGRVFVRFGKPFQLDVSPRAKGPELDAATDEIMCAIAALLPPAYRGVYAGHPLLKARLERTGG
jgi:1-acyl-sn-glycerol-3-phosphate acyltransferase